MTTTGSNCEDSTGERSCRQLSEKEVAQWFDSDGRLVKEAAMRKGLYEGECGLPSTGQGFI